MAGSSTDRRFIGRETFMEEEFTRGALEVEALREFIELAVQLKKAGVLDALRELLTDYEGKMTVLSNDIAIFRALALSTILTDSLRELEPTDVARIKTSATMLTRCALKGFGELSPDAIERKGLFGLLGALRDKDIQAGLGLLLGLAKNIGRCINNLKTNT